MMSTNQTQRIILQIYAKVSNRLGEPFCGVPADETEIKAIRFWISGVTVCIIGIPGKHFDCLHFWKMTAVCLSRIDMEHLVFCHFGQHQ